MSTLFKGLERIEEARERFTGASFMAGLFEGNPDFNVLLPPPEPPEERAEGEAYLIKMETFLKREVDPVEIERTAKIPDHVLRGLFRLGAFGMKIPKEYGGLGLSYKNYGRVLTLMASWSNILALTVAVPQSIGIAMPILLFGNERQKHIYLPQVAREAISAFALTEPMTGSDAANIQTRAVLDAGGESFVVSGEKLWCTNGPIARYVTLIARVPSRRVQRNGRSQWEPVREGQGAEDDVHSAFILDMASPGVEVRQRCQFEGCRGIENAHMVLHDVKLPVDSVIGEIGKGLKYALTILNVGRGISIPAICVGMAKQAWQPTLDRANTRLTFQKPVGERQTQQARIGRMAADLYAMEALAMLVWHLADQHVYDIRIEAAIAKMVCSERTIQFVRDAQIIFGGMGYETAESKQQRGEPAFGIEQLVRDAEMYRIGEGATDILRPFVVREGLGRHVEMATHWLGGKATGWSTIRTLWRMAGFYVPWYLRQWRRRALPVCREFQHPDGRAMVRYVERTSRRLARHIFFILLRWREGFRDEQAVQSRIEQIGEDLLIILATAIRAAQQAGTEQAKQGWELAHLLYLQARSRIENAFQGLGAQADRSAGQVGSRALKGGYPGLTEGVIHRGLEDYLVSPSFSETRECHAANAGNQWQS